MRILFLSSVFGTSAGGGEVSTKLLFNHLNNSGYPTYILTTRKPEVISNGLISLNIVNVLPTKFFIPGSIITDYVLSSIIAKKIQLIKPDIIHAQDSFIVPAAVIANKKLNLPLFVTCRNNVSDHYVRVNTLRSGMLKIWFKKRNKKFLKNLRYIHGIISISEYIKRELLEIGLTNSRIEIIHNLSPQIISNQFSKKNDSTIVLFAPGRLVVEKGFDIIIKAMKLIIQEKPLVKLIVAGEGPELHRLEKLVEILKLKSSVFFTGWIPQENIRAFYINSDIVLLSSVYPEPFGRVSIEAMSFGKPLVASDIGGIPEAVIDGVNGFLVPPGNYSAMAKAVLTLIRDCLLREKMGKAGQEILRRDFNPGEILKKTINFYTKILNS